MDNPNPIRYSDLITPDNSITTLISQLDDLIAKYDEAQKKIQGAAADASKSLQGLSGATDDQRQQIQSLTVESDKLRKSYEETNVAERETYRRRQEVIQAVKEEQQVDKLLVQINNSVEGSYNRLSAQYRLNKIRLNEMSEAQRKGTAAGRALEAETKGLYEKMNQLQLATGKAQLQVGHYERALGGVLGISPRIVTALTDTSQAATAVSGVFSALAGPIGIIIGLLGAGVAAFKLFRDSIHETQSTGDALDAAVGEWTGTWAAFKKAVSAVDFRGFIIGAREAAIAGRDLKLVLDETFERTNSAKILRASMSEENAILQETMRDQGKTLEERKAAADKYLANMKPIYEQETETARRNAEAQLEYLFSVTNRTEYATKQEREAAKQRFADYIKEYNLNEANIKVAKQYLKDQQDIKAAEDGLRKASTVQMTEYYNKQREEAQKRISQASEETKALAGIVKQYNLTNDAEVRAYVEAEEKYLTAKAAAYNDERRVVTLRNNLDAQQTNAATTNAKARQKAVEDEAKAEKKAAEEAEKARQKEIAEQRAILNAQLQSIQLQIAVTEQGTQEMLQLRLDMLNKQKEIELFENAQKNEKIRQDEAKITAKYNAMILRETAKFNHDLAQRDMKAAQDLAQAEFSLLDKNERQKTIFRLEQEKARLQAVLELNKTAVEKMTDTEVKAIQATIKAIEKEIGRTGYSNLYEVMGISINSEQQSALNSAIDSVKDSLDSLADSWMKIAEAAVAAADAQVDAAQRTLDAEIEARNNGYANEVQTAQKELVLAKKNQEKAMKEKEKAQRAQLRLDSLQQASSLVTATANIWKAFSGAGAIGIALAAIATATMWGAFAAAKVKATQATQTEQYGEGTVELLEGGSHASGNDIDLGRKKDGTRRRAEGGEYFAIINKRNSRRYRDVIPDVINSFNNGTFADRYQRANAAMAGYAVGMIGGGTDISGLEDDVAAIRRQGDENQYTDARGNTIIRYKNLTRKIKS